jgi:hypothetical protein
MPKGRVNPLANFSRVCAPPVFCGSRKMMISPAPVSARKISLFGATMSQRGLLNPVAKTLVLNPAGTVGRKPSGGLTLLGELADDFVAYGDGKAGFFPWVNCAEIKAGTHSNTLRQLRTFNRDGISVSSE